MEGRDQQLRLRPAGVSGHIQHSILFKGTSDDSTYPIQPAQTHPLMLFSC